MRTARRASEKRGPAVVPLRARSAEPLLLAPFSTRLPPELLQRLRLAAPRLELRMGEITAAALDAFLSERGH
ncbi:MAG: hypothetical protein ACRDOS_02475 [Gaiellaceae bacterium]